MTDKISPLSSASFIEPTIEAEEVIVEPQKNEPKVDFEEIERDMGKMLIVVFQKRRNHYHFLSQRVTENYKSQIKVQKDSYRTITPIVLTAISAGLQGASVVAIANPNLFVKGEGLLSTLANKKFECISGTYCDSNGCVDFKAVTDGTTKTLGFLDQMVQGVRMLKENRDQGDRVESGAESELLRGLSESQRQEKAKYGQEEGDAVRQFEQRRNKREDFELGMAR